MAALRHPNVVAFLGVCASPPCVATGAPWAGAEEGTGQWRRSVTGAAPPLGIPACQTNQLPLSHVAAEYCSRGSLTDVLRGGKGNATKARQLDWARRLNMVGGAAGPAGPTLPSERQD